MPGTTKFVAKVGDGWGFLDAGAEQFDPVESDKLLERACSKYHYRRIGPFKVNSPAEARQMAEAWMWP
jgi:hypothetical protein